jgi:DNA-binding SARP family transcriptional activator/tetratricopeptide (TPR) repeat protein
MPPNGDDGLRIDVLGALRVRRDNSPLAAGPVQQQVVLGVLALHRGRSVRRDDLIAAVWGRSPPGRAVNLIHRHVSGLRRVLDPPAPPGASARSRLQWAEAGYRLELAPQGLDLEEFEQGVAEAARLRPEDPQQAAATLRSVLTLWRGPVCDGLSSAYLDAERDRLAERRVGLQEDVIELEISSDPTIGPDAIDELRRLVAAHPTRERAHGLLMRALYRSGRVADSLEVYADARRYLKDELGIEPSAELRRLQHWVLTDAPQLSDLPQRPVVTTGRPIAPPPTSAPVAIPAQLPHTAATFVGRDSELSRLDELLPAVPAGAAPLLIAAIAGTAGIGKTSLALHWAHRIKDRFPDGQLYFNLRGFDPHAPPLEPVTVLRGFLDALGANAETIPLEVESQAGVFRSLLAGRRVLIVLDNAADADQVRPLIPGTAGSLVVVTSRDRLVSLVAREGATPVQLDLLTPEAAWQLLARSVGRERVEAEAGEAAAIISACGRLPLALSVVGARAGTNPHLPLAALAEELRQAGGSLDPFDGGEQAIDLRAVFSWSYLRLTEPAALLFRRLALAPGPDLSAAAAASLVGLPLRETRKLLVQLTRANLIGERRAQRYELHDLLRAYAGELADELDRDGDQDEARRRLVDHYLHSAYWADRLLCESRDDPIDLDPVPPRVTLVVLPDRAAAQTWFIQELATLVATIELAAQHRLDRQTWQLAWTLTFFLERRGTRHDSAPVYTTALAAAVRLGDLRAEALSHGGLAMAQIRLNRFDDAHRHLHQAARLYEQIGDTIGLAHGHRRIAWMLDKLGRHVEALPHARQALELFDEAGHQVGMARALNAVGWFLHQVGEHHEALEHCRRALRLQRQIADEHDQADTIDSIARTCQALGRYREAMASYREGIVLYRRFGHRYPEADALVHLGDVQLLVGDRDSARAVWEDAGSILAELEHPDIDSVRQRLAALGPVGGETDEARGVDL